MFKFLTLKFDMPSMNLLTLYKVVFVVIRKRVAPPLVFAKISELRHFVAGTGNNLRSYVISDIKLFMNNLERGPD